MSKLNTHNSNDYTMGIKDYVELIRPNVCMLAILGVLIGYIISPNPDISSELKYQKLLVAVFTALVLTGAGNVINDYFDYKIDKINSRNRPISRGSIKRKNAFIFYIILSISGLLASFFVSTQFLAIAVLYTFIFSIYSWKLKKSAFTKNITVSWISSFTLISGAFIFNTEINFPLVILFFTSLIGTFSREIFKDIEDIVGDSKQKIKTLAIILGPRKAISIAVALIFLSIILLLLPYFIGTYTWFYLITISPGIAMSFMSILNRNNPKRAQRLLKIAMYCVIIGFFLIGLFKQYDLNAVN